MANKRNAKLVAWKKESGRIAHELDRLMKLALKMNRKLKADEFGEEVTLNHHDYFLKATNVLIDTSTKDFAVIYQEHAMPMVVYLPDLENYSFKRAR
jgi:hypothetical protein